MTDSSRGSPSADDPMGTGAGAAPAGGRAADEEVRIVETTVGLVGDQRVGAGNLWASDYALPDGSTATGMTAQLFLLAEGTRTIVGPGSVVDIGDAQWEVTAVEKPERRRHGWVVLRRRPGPSTGRDTERR